MKIIQLIIFLSFTVFFSGSVSAQSATYNDFCSRLIISYKHRLENNLINAKQQLLIQQEIQRRCGNVSPEVPAMTPTPTSPTPSPIPIYDNFSVTQSTSSATSKDNIIITDKHHQHSIQYHQAVIIDDINLDELIITTPTSIEIDTKDKPNLNQPAKLTFKDIDFKSPKVLHDDKEGSKNIISVKHNEQNREVEVEVTGFSKYEVVEGYLTWPQRILKFFKTLILKYDKKS